MPLQSAATMPSLSKLYRDPIYVQWLLLLGGLTLLASVLGYALIERRAGILDHEQQRMLKQGQVIEANMRVRSEVTHQAFLAALAAIPADDIRRWKQPGILAHLHLVKSLMGNMHSISLVDAQGVVINSSDDTLPGQNLGQQLYFRHAQALAQQEKLYSVSFASVTSDERASWNTAAILNPHGEVIGYLMGRSNASLMNTLLDSVRYADDMQMVVVTDEGIAVHTVPHNPAILGKDINVFSPKFAEHRHSNEKATFVLGYTGAKGARDRLGMMLRIDVLVNETPTRFHVFMNRDRQTILTSWRSDVITVGASYALLVAILLGLQTYLSWRQRTAAAVLTRAQDRLTESEADLRTILDNLPVMVSAWDENQCNRFLNPAYERVFGMNIEEQRGRQMRDVITPTYYDHNKPFIDRVLQGEPQSFDLTINIPGNPRPMQTLMFYIPRFVDGQTKGFYVVLLDVTAMAAAQAETLAAKASYDELVCHIPVGVFTLRVDPAGSIGLDYASARFLAMTDIRSERRNFGLEEMLERVHPLDKSRFLGIFMAAANESAPISFECRYMSGEDTFRWIRFDITQQESPAGVRSWHGISSDVTEQRRLQDERELAAAVFEHSQEAIFICENGDTIARVNPAFTRITGYARNEVIGRNPEFLKRSPEDSPTSNAVGRGIRRKGFWRGEVVCRRKNGQEFATLMSISMVSGTTSSGNNFVGSFTDISWLKEHEAELHEIAHYDALTKIPNRRLLQDRLQQAIERARRRDTLLAVCYMDLDGFKPINDSLGHEAGDKVLVVIAERLRNAIRADDTVARLGGDEFVLLLGELENIDECKHILTRVLHTIEEPVPLGKAEGHVSASIGVTLFPFDLNDADTLLRHADLAMYGAKNSGKRRYHFYAAGELIDTKVSA